MGCLGVYRVMGDEIELTGHLSVDDGSFSYDPAYLQSRRAAALSCSLPLGTGSFPADAARPYFEGLLPEGNARQVVAAKLRVRDTDYLSMLAGYGFECIGDVVVAGDKESLTGGYAPADVTNLACELGEGKAAEINGVSRLSLAGTQNKVGLYHDPRADSWDEGWYKPLDGAASTHILKTSAKRNVLYLEYLCTKAAGACGVPVANVELLDLGGPVLCSERYDRVIAETSGDMRVTRCHQEDFAQAFGILPSSKYAELEGGTVCRVAEFIRRRFAQPIQAVEGFACLTLFNYLIGNCDNHLKNVSILYSLDWQKLTLAPAYDLVCTTWFPDLSREMGMRLGGEGRIDEVGPEHLAAFAKETGLPPKRLRALCADLVSHVDEAIDAAAALGPAVFDELDWKAADLHEDIAPRRAVLEKVAR